MTAETTAGEAGRGWLRALQILGLILGLFFFVSKMEFIAGVLGLDPLRASIGAYINTEKAADQAAPTEFVAADGAMAKAGVKLGHDPV